MLPQPPQPRQPEPSPSALRRKVALAVTLSLLAGYGAFVIHNAKNYKYTPVAGPSYVYHVPPKCQMKAFFLMGEAADGQVPMELASRLWDLTLKCGGRIEKIN